MTTRQPSFRGHANGKDPWDLVTKPPSQPKQLRRTVLLHNEPSYPAKAGIQYAAAYRFHHDGSGILDHPPSRMMTAGCGADSYVNQIQLRIPAARCARIVPEDFAPQEIRARGMPGARCTRSLVCKGRKHTSSHHGRTGITRHSRTRWC